jgi:hypothetical protein
MYSILNTLGQSIKEFLNDLKESLKANFLAVPMHIQAAPMIASHENMSHNS